MGQWYNIKCDFKYNGPAKYNELESWLGDNIESVNFEYDHFRCWGENHYGLDEEILERLSAAGNLEGAELDAHMSDDGSRHYTWNLEKKCWDIVTGKMLFNADEAEAEFGKSKAHKAVENILAAYVNNDFDATYDRAYCRDALAAAGCGKELADEIGLGYLFEEETEDIMPTGTDRSK